MEINTFNTNEGLIDLHIHSDYSYSKDEYMKTGLKPLELLKEIKEFSSSSEGQVVFSLTDHDNSFGAKEIFQKIQANPNDYNYVKFIPGIEFSVCCDSLGSYLKPKKNSEDKRREDSRVIVGDLHLLGYNYDVNNPTINYYSKINSLEEENSFTYQNGIYPYGAIILAGKKFLLKAGIPLSLERFLDFKIEDSHCERIAFIRNVNNFCHYCSENFYLGKSIISDMKFFLLGINPKTFLENKELSAISVNDINLENVVNNSKLDIMEAMAILENAGGVSVLAHPYIIELNSKYVDLFAGKADEKGFIPKRVKGKLSSNNFNEYIDRSVLAKEELLNYILEKLVYNAYNPTTREKLQGLVGIELLHKANIFKGYFSTLTELAKKYNLYTTGGSDKHGSKNNKVLSVGQIMPNYIENYFPKSDKRKIAFSIFGCTFVDDILEGNQLERKRNNDDIEILVKTDDKFKVFDYHNVKRFVSSYAHTDCYNIAKNYNVPKSKLDSYRSNIVLEPILDNSELKSIKSAHKTLKNNEQLVPVE